MVTSVFRLNVSLVHFTLMVTQVYRVRPEGCAGDISRCQNNKNVSLKICLFSLDRCHIWSEDIPDLEASNLKAEKEACSLRYSACQML